MIYKYWKKSKELNYLLWIFFSWRSLDFCTYFFFLFLVQRQIDCLIFKKIKPYLRVPILKLKKNLNRVEFPSDLICSIYFPSSLV